MQARSKPLAKKQLVALHCDPMRCCAWTGSCLLWCIAIPALVMSAYSITLLDQKDITPSFDTPQIGDTYELTTYFRVDDSHTHRHVSRLCKVVDVKDDNDGAYIELKEDNNDSTLSKLSLFMMSHGRIGIMTFGVANSYGTWDAVPQVRAVDAHKVEGCYNKVGDPTLDGGCLRLARVA